MTPRDLLDRARNSPPPIANRPHAPGWTYRLDEKHGELLLFDTACEPFNLTFTASLSWRTDGDPGYLLSLSMQPGDVAYWTFETPEEPEALADRTDALHMWLDDLGVIVAYLLELYPDIPVERIR